MKIKAVSTRSASSVSFWSNSSASSRYWRSPQLEIGCFARTRFRDVINKMALVPSTDDRHRTYFLVDGNVRVGVLSVSSTSISGIAEKANA
jgi:hypothetical protein